MTNPIERPDPAEQAKLDRAKKPKGWAERYPKPEQADIEELYTRLKPAFDEYFALVEENRAVRYLQDETPQKWRRRLQGARRFRSRLSHNEILRIAAMMTRNAPKVKIPQSGEKAKDEKRGDKQSRWSNNLFKALEHGRPFLRRFCDSIAGNGLGVLEFYLTEDTPYDNLDTTARDIIDPKTGETRPETPDEIMARTDSELEGAPLPFGVRYVHPTAAYYDEDEDGTCAALIVEMKPYRQVYNKLRGKSVEQVEKLRLPRPGTMGWPVSTTDRGGTFEDGSANWYSTELGGESDARSGVLTMRYYDRRWYGYIVGGVVVDGFTEHKLPGLPIFPCLGMVTESERMAERQQGVTWGMTGMELAINDQMTLDMDTAFTTSRPKPVIETDINATGVNTRDKLGKPATIDLTGDATPYLDRGQRIVDAFEHLRPNPHSEVVNAILQMWQRSGLNPIAQGESPGADAAGYTVNTLSQAAQSQYEILLDNYARCLGNIVDFARLTVRDTIKEKVYLSVPMADAKKGGTEWLALGPDDVDETPSIVTIDPLSDANRMALRQSLEQGNKDGYVPREVVQREGYGADDPEAWDDDLIVDAAEQDLAAQAREEAKAIAAGRTLDYVMQSMPPEQLIAMIQQRMAQVPPGGAGGQTGGSAQVVPGSVPPGAPGQPAPTQPGQDENPPAAGAAVPTGPAPTQPPSVGTANQAASTQFAQTKAGPAPMPSSTALAGTPRGGGTGRAA